MSNLTSRQQIVLFAVLTIVWVAWTMFANFNGAHLDISALFMAGWLTGNGQEELIYLAPEMVYNNVQVPIWREVMIAQDMPDTVVTAYIYPPIWAKVLAGPTHALGAQGFFHAVFVWHMIAALLTAILAYFLLPDDARPDVMPWGLTLFAILFGTWPVINAFLTNQPQITTNLMIVAAFLLVLRGRSIEGGALIGLAAAIKVSPILFALIFVLNRNWQALAASLVVSGGLALLSILVMGWPLHQQFLDRLSEINGLIVMVKINYSPEALLYQFAELIKGVPMVDGRLRISFQEYEPLWIGIVIKTAFVLVLGLFWIATRNLPDAKRVNVQFLLMSLITALFGPLSWAHYFYLPALLLPSLFLVMPAKRAWGWIAAVLIVSSLFAFSVLHRFNHYFMFTALVPMLVYLALLFDTLRAAWRGRSRDEKPT